MKKLILFLVIATSILSGCKKYTDGPLISLNTAKGRFLGMPTLTKYTVNGVDSLSLYYDSLSTSFDFHYDDYNNRYVCVMDGGRKDGHLSILTWVWELKNHNKIFSVTSSSGERGTGPFGDNKMLQWEILKLKHNDKILKTNYNGKEYLIELKGY